MPTTASRPADLEVEGSDGEEGEGEAGEEAGCEKVRVKSRHRGRHQVLVTEVSLAHTGGGVHYQLKQL